MKPNATPAFLRLAVRWWRSGGEILLSLRSADHDTAHHIFELEEINASIAVLIDGGDHLLYSVHLFAFLLQS